MSMDVKFNDLSRLMHLTLYEVYAIPPCPRYKAAQIQPPTDCGSMISNLSFAFLALGFLQYGTASLPVVCLISPALNCDMFCHLVLTGPVAFLAPFQ